MDQTTLVIQQFLEDPFNSIIVVPNDAAKVEFEARTAPVHHGRIIAAIENLHGLLNLPPETLVLVSDAEMIDPSLLRWLAEQHNLIVSWKQSMVYSGHS